MTNFTPRSGEGGWGAARADLKPAVLNGWRVATVHGPPDALLAAPAPHPPHRLLRWCVPTATALVLGNSQRRPGLRRRTGGTAVLVRPGRLVWADVVLPRDDPLHVEDVSRSSQWLGAAWADALRSLGVEATVYDGPIVRPEGVCFAGVSPGEVVVGGAKVVGISQRRTRDAALFQCAALRYREPDETAAGELGDLRGIEEAFEHRLALA